MATQPLPKLSEEEYLSRERAAERKSEYIDGQAVLMPGGSLRHSLLAMNCGAALVEQLRAKPIFVFTSDARVRIAGASAYVYPDLSIVKGVPQTFKGTSDILINPAGIIEVLSPSTAEYDHVKKFELYREIPSLSDYLMVNASFPWVEHYARQEDGSWTYREYRGIEAIVVLPSFDCVLALVDIYRGTAEVPE